MVKVSAGTGLALLFMLLMTPVCAAGPRQAPIDRYLFAVPAPVSPMPATRAPLVALLPSPAYYLDQTVYLVTAEELLRSTDGGASWAIAAEGVGAVGGLTGVRGADRDGAQTPIVTAGIIAAADNRVTLLLVFATGELHQVDPAALTWQPVDDTVDPLNTLPGAWHVDDAVALLQGKTGTPLAALYTTQFTQDGLARALLLTYDARLHDCRQCYVYFSLARFTHNSYGWTLDRYSGDVVNFVVESWEHLNVRKVQAGPDRYGLMLENRETIEGGERTEAYLVAEPTPDHYATLFRTAIHEKHIDKTPCSDPAATCTEFFGDLRFKPGSHPDLHDLHLILTGTQLVDGVVQPVNERQVYVFGEGGFALTRTSNETAELAIDIDYSDEFYTRVFDYSRDAPNVWHVVLIVPSADKARFEGVPVFSSLRIPSQPGQPLTIRKDRPELAWVLDYVHLAPRGFFHGTLAPGGYTVQVAFLTAPVGREQVGASEDAILWPGITGGGASSDQREIQLSAGEIKSVQFRLTDANGWACPWLYVHDGQGYRRVTEILRQVHGTAAQTSERTRLGATPVVDGAVRLLLAEEKAETSYLDALTLIMDGILVQLDPLSAGRDALSAVDNHYLRLVQGDTEELVFPLPSQLAGRRQVDVTVVATGYYVPDR